mmetsp:Transcript_32388/g.81855  ORF Transcript_32388/g.81855 Transcript_32388/m.81855 type:complete len:193 (+) Transcript_32388:1-579(+)
MFYGLTITCWLGFMQLAFIGMTPSADHLRLPSKVLVGRSSRAAVGPALAPAPVRPAAHPGLPARIDESRFGEKVRWLMEDDVEKPPEWRVLLLSKTYANKANTVSSVAACLAAVLGLAVGLAKAKAQHARDHFFSVVATEVSWSEAMRKAQGLQGRGLVVRVVPGTSRSTEDAGRFNEPESTAAPSQRTARR